MILHLFVQNAVRLLFKSSINLFILSHLSHFSQTHKPLGSTQKPSETPCKLSSKPERGAKKIR